MDEDDWTPDMRTIAEYTKRVGEAVLDHPLSVVIARDRTWPHAACYSKGEIILNYSKLGGKWFASGSSQRVNALLTHEFAHHYADCHLSKEFYNACCKVSAAFTALALSKPELFNTDD